MKQPMHAPLIFMARPLEQGRDHLTLSFHVSPQGIPYGFPETAGLLSLEHILCAQPEGLCDVDLHTYRHWFAHAGIVLCDAPSSKDMDVLLHPLGRWHHEIRLYRHSEGHLVLLQPHARHLHVVHNAQIIAFPPHTPHLKKPPSQGPFQPL